MADETSRQDAPHPPGKVRSSIRRALGRRGVLWLGFLAAVVPLAVMLVVQYLWLVDLEKTSSMARRMQLQKRAGVIAKEVHGFYAGAAEKLLAVPASRFTDDGVRLIRPGARSGGLAGFRRFFVVSFRTRDYLLFWNETSRTMEVPRLSDETVAVWAAVSPWGVRAKRGQTVASTELTVDERDGAHRMILKPIVDSGKRLVGLAGVIVDEGTFTTEVLPKAIQATAAAFGDNGDLRVAVHDARGHTVLARGGTGAPKKGGVSWRLSFVHTDWYLILTDARETPESWARRNFTFNLSLSAALALALLAGVLLVLRTASREMALSAMKSDFVSNVSHELRTPIASIRVFGELMRLGRVSDPDKVREYGGHIETESRRLTQLVNNILDFSRIESGRKVYVFAEADVAEVVREAVATFDIRVASAGFRIDLSLPEKPLPPIRIDRAAIDQAVCNLLDNAVKYSGESRDIEVRVEGDERRVVIAVTDHGIGIPREERERVFERFHRVGTGLVHEVRGVGLGLAIVRHVVDAHGGKVSLETELGAGSTFSLVLPIAAGVPGPAQPA